VKTLRDRIEAKIATEHRAPAQQRREAVRNVSTGVHEAVQEDGAGEAASGVMAAL
jgi:hypothetical protein